MAKLQVQAEYMEEQEKKGMSEGQQQQMTDTLMKQGLNLIWKLGKLEVKKGKAKELEGVLGLYSAQN